MIPYESWDYFSVSLKNILGLCRDCIESVYCLRYFAHFNTVTNRGRPPIYLCFLEFLSSVIYSFQCIDLSTLGI
jgi:hypothetical protein